MNYRAFVQYLLYAHGIDDIIDNPMLKKNHELLVHLEDLYNGRKTGIDRPKK